MDGLRNLTNQTIRHITVVGGDSQHNLLNHLSAETTGCSIHLGHREATTWGNACLTARSIDHG
jgi:sugar (pentulose or hexulose) kinase